MRMSLRSGNGRAPLAPRIQSASSSIANLTGTVRRGKGVGILSCWSANPELELCFIIDELRYELTLIARAEIRKLPHVRAVNDFVVSRRRPLSHLIEGRMNEADGLAGRKGSA